MEVIAETKQEKRRRINKAYYEANKEKWKAHNAKQKEKGYFERYYEANKTHIITQVKRRYHEKKGQPLTGGTPVASVGDGTKTPTMRVTSDQ